MLPSPLVLLTTQSSRGSGSKPTFGFPPLSCALFKTLLSLPAVMVIVAAICDQDESERASTPATRSVAERIRQT